MQPTWHATPRHSLVHPSWSWPLPPPPPPPLQHAVDTFFQALERSGALRTLIDGAARSQTAAAHTLSGSHLGHVRLRFVDEDRWQRERQEEAGVAMGPDSSEDDDAWDSCSAHAAAEHTLNAVMPLHALRVLVPQRRAPLPPSVAAAAVKGTAELEAAARTLLAGVEAIRAAFVPSYGPARLAQLTQFHSHFHADDDAFDPALSGGTGGGDGGVGGTGSGGRLSDAEAAAVLAVEALFVPWVEHLKANVVGPLLGCAADGASATATATAATARLQCPRRTWYVRPRGAAQNRVVHQDVAGGAFDGWLNVWSLLSEGVGDPPAPLVLLDPSGVSRREARAWRGERVHTYASMRRGDSIVWRSNRVPHATGRYVDAAAAAAAAAGGGDAGDDRGDDEEGGDDGVDGAAAWEAARLRRSSFDFRCRCVEDGAPSGLPADRDFDVN